MSKYSYGDKFYAVIGKYKRFIWRVLVLIWYKNYMHASIDSDNNVGIKLIVFIASLPHFVL